MICEVESWVRTKILFERDTGSEGGERERDDGVDNDD